MDISRAVISQILLFLYGVIDLSSASDANQPVIRNRDVMSARVESCYGCKVNRLPEVRRFLLNDLPFFHNVEIKEVHGATPEVLLLNKDKQVVERIDLTTLNQKECNMVLIKKGFYKKKSIISEVPEKYQTGPYGVREIPKFHIDIDDDQEIYIGQAADIRRKEEL